MSSEKPSTPSPNHPAAPVSFAEDRPAPPPGLSERLSAPRDLEAEASAASALSEDPLVPLFPTSPTSPVTPSMPGSSDPKSLSAASLYQRKAQAERRTFEWRAARLQGDVSRAALREAEASAGRHAAALRAALRDLDDAVGQVRDARRRIGEAVVIPRPLAHASCTAQADGAGGGG